MPALVVCNDLLFGSQLLSSVRGAFTDAVQEFAADRALERAATASLVVLDLDTCGAGLDQLVQELKRQQPSVVLVAVGPHVQAARLAQAQAAGCDHVLSRGQAIIPATWSQLSAVLASREAGNS